MTDSAEIIFLGTGTSHGIPMIGCDCDVCRSHDPRDRRYRASAAVLLPEGPATNGRVLLIDTPPEFRLAAIANELRRVDAVLITHAHADHILGMDDLRRYNAIAGGTIPVLGRREEIDRTRAVFRYAERPYDNPDIPSLAFDSLDGPTDVCGAMVTPVPLMHGLRPILGFRIGQFAYCTDCSAIPQTSRSLLSGLDLLVINALRYTPHSGHFNLAQALEAIEGLKPRRALLTHIAHEIRHAVTEAELPPNVMLAYDGLRVRAAL